MGKKQLLALDHITMRFSQNKQLELSVIQDLSFSLFSNELISIVGPNGCGKTTLLNIIAGFIKPSSGSVIYNNNSRSAAGKYIQFIPQDLLLFHWMSVLENVVFGLKANGLTKKLAVRRALLWLKKLGLNSFIHYYPFELSGGMQQKLALARALALHPKIILMDEPFANLDWQTREKLEEDLLSLTSKNKLTIIMVSHDIEKAVYLSNKIIILSNRPSYIKSIVDIDVEYGLRDKFRSSQKFTRICQKIRLLLKE